MSVPSAAELTRARTARRYVAILLVLAGVIACVLNLLDVSGGALGEFRLLITMGFLLLGPGWAAAGFLRRAPAAHVWLLTLGVGTAVTLIGGQLMVSLGLWYPSVALFLVTLISVPFLLRHAVVAQ
ncbi:MULTISPECIES: hypothetical protein [Pseudonocardia]|uniref:Uncharacterized protein n=2 Tax=Pseudonocardia TaxID=1847 RepID=A0A1Y2N1W6_PSEAH|nr:MULTISPECIES: hypothetical protein [Pseudonocardia]OSY41463.1 hypothetical protein BG845_01954 [Pseudonocardia autotrophica]TDN71420.1 hypothetical protein C8E95_0450 [Pseudonocardia autotrophica]BBG02095.1 hypothetical protein Pdca_33040 [Pseudonocardia autotrophica]GEC24109.1 hypothetical protein PSA01_11380 [Pseudonocardia saturnea]